jgi:enamine deaminase RidA (YjgF/YER057c/UK114 family)
VRGRLLESKESAEVFLTVEPSRRGKASEQAEEVFSAVRTSLESCGARLLQERIFATEAALPAILAARSHQCNGLDDGVPPVLLVVPEGPAGPVAGVQVHAVRSPAAMETVRSNGKPRGRAVNMGDCRFVAISGLAAPSAGEADAQAQSMFAQAAATMKELGGSMHSVARTWLWLGDILAWYDDLNRVRNRFFKSVGLIDSDPNTACMPASTGIGVYPSFGAACAMDLVAVVGKGSKVEYFREAGNQRSPYHYGSAFSRASRTPSPAGATVYVSGTAAIDTEGRTAPIGDAKGQVSITIENVRAAFRDLGCSDGEVVQAIAYSKTPEVQAIFHKEFASLEWPCISVIADVCRDDLLFEVEAAACPGARKM